MYCGTDEAGTPVYCYHVVARHANGGELATYQQGTTEADARVKAGQFFNRYTPEYVVWSVTPDTRHLREAV